MKGFSEPFILSFVYCMMHIHLQMMVVQCIAGPLRDRSSKPLPIVYVDARAKTAEPEVVRQCR